MVSCPCCSRPLLAYVQDHRMVWFCRHCWQEMPALEDQELSSLQAALNLSHARQFRQLRRDRLGQGA